MSKKSITFALACGAFALGANAVHASDMTVVVNASENGVAYFLSMPAAGIKDVLGTDPGLLFSENGKVPIDDFRVSGSFELGDKVFARLDGIVGGEVAPFETMSMMVHPLDDPAPFQTPWDAITATSVCNVEYGSDQLTPDVLQLYFGSYAHDIDATSGLDLKFPFTGRDPIDVTVYLYQDGDYLGQEHAHLQDGGTLSVSFFERAEVSFLWWAAVGLWALLMIAAIAMPRRGKQTSNMAGTSI